MRIRQGDRVTIPTGWLRMSMNPLQSSGRMSRAGIQMLAGDLFVNGSYKREDEYEADASALERLTDEIVNAFPPLVGLDVNNASDRERIIEVMEEHEGTREFWALWTGHFLAIAGDARSQNDAVRSSRATACAERFRAMMQFKEAPEEVVVMGSAVRRVVDVLQIWNAQKDKKDEEWPSRRRGEKVVQAPCRDTKANARGRSWSLNPAAQGSAAGPRQRGRARWWCEREAEQPRFCGTPHRHEDRERTGA